MSININIKITQDSDTYTDGLYLNLAKLEGGDIALTLTNNGRVINVKGDDLLNAVQLLQKS